MYVIKLHLITKWYLKGQNYSVYFIISIKCPYIIHTKGRHLDNLMNWIIRMGNTVVWSDDPGNDSGDEKEKRKH